ncbi:MAG TPA: AAA family ATPase [Candidatus Elarobacter sp.]|jgi:DNA-binding SARP family transcriptional activator
MLRVQLFGRPRLSLDGVALSAGGRPKVVPLLGYLLVHRGAPVSRRTVANALWPDEAEDEARANLRRHLNYLHALLPPAADDRPWILASVGEVRWNPACNFQLDVDEFERLAALAHRLADAVALYEGDLLADFEEEWLEVERARLKTLYRAALDALVASLRAARDYAPAIAAAQRLLADDPWRDDVLRTLMRLRHEAGDRAGALHEYERFARTLRDELGTEPMAETQAVYASIAHDAAPAGESRAPAPSGRAQFAVPQRDGAAAFTSLPFVGRSAELRALRARWDAAVAGHGSLVLVGGEAGIGKTRLVREFAAQCESHGAQVYSAGTTLPETVPYQPFVTLLRVIAPLAATVSVDPLWLSAIAVLAPSIAEHARDLPPLPAVDAGRERTRLFEACSSVWAAIATRRPVVLVVEDVQWAGAATLGLLEHLARGALRGRVLIVVTYREDELALGHELRAVRRRLERDASASHVALSRLARDEVEALVRALGGSADPAALARDLHDRSDGNPFFLEETLRDLAETGRLHASDDAARAEPRGTSVPPAVRGVLAARLARLGERAMTLAEVAAVIGRGFDVELLRETTGWLEADVLDALGELTDRRIVGEQSAGSGFDYAFGHHLIQTMVYEGVASAARARRHRRVAHVMAELYSERGDDIAAELALHWDRGGEPELAADRYLAAARRALGVYGNDDAARNLVRALELSTSRRVRFDALLLRERIAGAAGDRALQAEITAELTRLARSIDDEDATCTALERRIALAQVTGERRRERVLLALLQRRARRSRDVRWHAAWLEGEARYRRAVNDFGAAREAFAELIALTERTGDRGAHANARLAFADTYIYEGRLDEAYRALDDLRAVVHAAGDQGALVRTLIAFSRAALAQQDYAAMSRFATEAHDVSRAIGDREGEALALHTIANGLVYTFRVGDAESYYLRALELYERIGHRVGLASIFVDLGLFHTELGLLDRALEFYARAREIAGEIGFPFVACVERIDASYCYRLRGELGNAKDSAESALALAREIKSQHLESAALGTLGAAETVLGDDAAAIAHLARAVELRRPAGATPRLGDNLCALALASLHAGDADGARRAADELLALYDANPKLAPQPTEWLWTAAQVELARGGADAAHKLLRQAYSVMHARAAVIDDEATRAAYLALPFNRAVAEAAAVSR